MNHTVPAAETGIVRACNLGQYKSPGMTCSELAASAIDSASPGLS